MAGPQAHGGTEWGDAQDRIQYEYFRDFYLPCMTALGYEPDTAAIPSEDEWVAQLDGDLPDDLWWPSLWGQARG